MSRFFCNSLPKSDVLSTRAGKLSLHFLDVVNVIQRFQSFNDLFMSFVFFQFCTADGDRHRVHAEPGIHIGGIGLDVVDCQTKTADRSYKILQIGAVHQLQMHLKMIGSILKISFKGREQGQTAQKGNERDYRYRVVSGAGRQTNDAAGPQANGGGQALDLVTGAERS